MNRPDYIENIPNAERRFIASQVKKVQLEKRSDEKEGAVIRGIAAKVNEETSIGGWFREVIMPGAFDEVLQNTETLDVRCLFNHDANLILARANKNTDTLRLFINEQGHLAYEYETPDITYAKDLAKSIELGNVSQSSFAFKIGEQSWVWDEEDESNDLRKIIRVSELLDVSPVTYPAYPNTEVGERSHKAAKAAREERNNDKQSRASYPKLRDAQFKFNQNKSK